MTSSEALDKIKKLLKTNGRTDHEKDTAQIIAAALADKHGIDLASVDTGENQSTITIIGRDVDRHARTPVEAVNASLICKNFFEVDPVMISRMTSRGYETVVRLVGTPLHVDIAEHVFKFLVNQFRWIGRHKRGTCRRRKDFMDGLYLGLSSKLRARFPERVESALILSLKARREKWIEENLGKTTTSNARLASNTAAANKGFQRGREIEIRPAVHAAPARNLLAA